MINPFHKIAISTHINLNNDKIRYSYRPDLLNGLYEASINYKGFVSIQMRKDKNGDTLYCLEYNIHYDDDIIVQPHQQNLFDKIFINRMYSKMLYFYQLYNKRQY